MKTKNIRHLPVVQSSKLIGMVSQRDVLFCLYQEYQNLNLDLQKYITG